MRIHGLETLQQLERVICGTIVDVHDFPAHVNAFHGESNSLMESHNQFFFVINWYDDRDHNLLLEFRVARS